ncbi:CamS family sex pheromone protein [Priestia koreensis]|uniref:CamS family sex pheromone protein n=1 Tax=Priestia koreensis TaxID=284581 RepID=UPI001FDEE52A|nr:CamS family sex pheromone protein [Priestia koreensis]
MYVLKRALTLSLGVMLVMSACAPNFSKEQEIVQKTDDSKEKAIIPNYSISSDTYNTTLPYKEGVARGLVASNLNNRMDTDEFETGLMRLAKDNYPSSKYLFQEGQYIDKDTAKAWVARKLTDQQYAQAKKKNKDVQNIGLNPINTNNKGGKTSPIYLSHLVEQDYLVKKNGKEVELGGIMLGLAMNPVNSYVEADGTPQEEITSRAKLQDEGQKIANQVVERMRKMKGLENVPINIALFEEKPNSSKVPGSFIAAGTSNEGSVQVDGWSKIDEEYALFPSTQASDEHSVHATKFNNFKKQIEKYFPNFTSAVGQGFYKDGSLQKLDITIEVQFKGKGELVGFTQFVAGEMTKYFPKNIETNVNIQSVESPESIIVRKKNQDKPFVHIYK